jgi:hypothetical protein
MGLCLSCFGGRKEKVHDPEVGQVIAEPQLELEPKTLYIACVTVIETLGR